MSENALFGRMDAKGVPLSWNPAPKVSKAERFAKAISSMTGSMLTGIADATRTGTITAGKLSNAIMPITTGISQVLGAVENIAAIGSILGHRGSQRALEKSARFRAAKEEYDSEANALYFKGLETADKIEQIGNRLDEEKLKYRPIDGSTPKLSKKGKRRKKKKKGGGADLLINPDKVTKRHPGRVYGKRR